MTEPDMILNDLFHSNRWQGMLAGVRPGEELELGQVHQIVCDGAAAPARERCAEAWLASFLSFLERAGAGSVRVRVDRSYALVLADPLPSRETAWSRVQSSWD